MSEHKDRPARQEADMLESLFAERQRMVGKANNRTSGTKKPEQSDSKSDAAKTTHERTRLCD